MRPKEFEKLKACFFPKSYQKYSYLGYAYNCYAAGTKEHELVEEFIRWVDSKARPKFVPKFLLRLIELYGNDNSIVRVRNRFLHNLSRRILDGIRITDIKTKYSHWEIRIYGCFSDEIWNRIDLLEEEISRLSPYKEEHL